MTTAIAIIGLGNPGAEYIATRHNAGFWLANAVAEQAKVSFRVESKFFGEYARCKIAGADVHLLKPSTFMNRSGQSVAALAQFFKIEASQLLIAHDELDMPAGQVRLKLGGGHGGHNGLRDVHKPLGEGYRRARIGIGHPGDKNLVLNYVLGRPNKSDAAAIHSGINKVLTVLPIWLSQTWDKAVQELHRQD